MLRFLPPNFDPQLFEYVNSLNYRKITLRLSLSLLEL
jgi:hypothetical protein